VGVFVTLQQTRRWVAGGVVFLGAGYLGWAADENEPPAEPSTPHPECSYFGPRREHFNREGLIRPGGGSAVSALTEQVVGALPPGGPPSRSRSSPRAENFIDQHIFTTLTRLGIPPAEPAGDAEFLRRVTLDLTGRIPTTEAVVEFLADTSPDKRSRVINQLLDSPQWADRWAMFFGDLFRNTINTAHLNRYQQARDQYHYYILDSLRENKPYHEMARELISNGGDTWQVGQANFTLTGRTTGGPVQDTYDTQAVNVATMFLGMGHLDCILCHDGAGHLESLSVWGAQAKRVDAWGMAAFFARTSLTIPGGNGARPWSVNDLAAGNYNLNTTSGNRPARRAIGAQTFVAPRYMFGTGGTPEPGENWRGALARLVTSDLQFARATVNYIWKEFMVLGLVEPADQFDPFRLDPANPPPAPWALQPSNPYLLDALARSFVRQNYDLKALMRDIVSSRAYQLSARYNGQWNPDWERYYARRLVRRLRAEEIHDAIVLSSGVIERYTIPGFRERIDFAMQLPDVVGVPGGQGGQLLDAFQRGNRQDVDRRSELSLLQALNLMNNGFVYQRARNQTGTYLFRVFQLPNDQLVEALYLNILSRLPTSEEKAAAIQSLASGNRSNKAEDLAWSLYNKVDFIFNY
jgi:hypothetical protein